MIMKYHQIQKHTFRAMVNKGIHNQCVYMMVLIRIYLNSDNAIFGATGLSEYTWQ